MTRRPGSWLIAAAAVLAGAGVARAGCTTDDDAADARATVQKTARCWDKKLKKGPTQTCATIPPAPACSESLTVDAIALAYGPNNPPTAIANGGDLSDQRRCQTQIGRGVYDFVKKLKYITQGDTPAEAETRARVQLDKIPLKCAVTVAQHATSGVVLPAVGPQCAAAVGPPGSAVDAVALRDCLLALMRTWIDRVVPSPQPLRPNIVLILTDDQRWDTTDATHAPDGVTPMMPGVRAELADQGVEFQNAFLTTPLCCPSRSSILSGLYAHRHGVYDNGGTNGGADDFEDALAIGEAVSVGSLLQAAGYRTGFYGKYLNGYNALWTDPNPPYVPAGWSEWHAFRNVAFFNYTLVRNGVGFDHVQQAYGAAETDYSTDVLRELAREFITTSVGMGQPFYLQLNLKAPHTPRTPAPRHVDKFAGIPPWRPPNYNEDDVSDKPTWLQNVAQMSPTKQADTDDLRQRQLEMLQANDEAIGGSTTYGITGLMQTLRDLGIADTTFVVYMSDNGFQWGEHRQTAKNKPYEESIRTPLFVRYPPLAPLRRLENKMALNIDLCPTFAELVGAGVPILQDGTSLVRLADGTTPTWRTDFMTEGWPNNREWATVREERWKYTELPLTPGDPGSAFELELYDLESDPYELTNVAGDPANTQRIIDMATRLRAIRPAWPVDADGELDDSPED